MNKYLGASVDCECGQTHDLPIKEIIIEERALQQVPVLLERLTDKRKISLIVDNNTYKAAGKLLLQILQDRFQVTLIKLEDEHLVPDPDTMFEVLQALDRESYVIACGSGTINDLTRYLTYKMGLPYLIVATAPSMDGYASSVAPLTIDGVKKTYSAAPPEAIVADLSILQEAPWEMIQAGFGDLLGKATSLLDWRLSNLLFDEYICEAAVELVREELDQMVELGRDLKNRTSESIDVLTNGLVNSGLAMLMVGYSRPASGCEHHISHYLDMLSHLYDKEVPSHGIKVGLATYFTSRLYLKFGELDFADLEYRETKEERIEGIKEGYPGGSETILAILDERWEKDRLDIELLREKETKIKEVIAEYSQYLEKTTILLKEIGILEREDVGSINKEWLRRAFKYGFEIRDRYTLVTLLHQVGLLDDWIEGLIVEFN